MVRIESIGMNLTDEVLKRISIALSNNIHVVNLNLSNNHVFILKLVLISFLQKVCNIYVNML